MVGGSIDNLLRPKLLGGRTELPNLLVLLGTLGGLVFFGPVGIVLGPVVSAVFLTVWKLYASACDDDTSGEDGDAPGTPDRAPA